MNPLISVIIINCNGKHFLERCLSSLLKTDYDNFEVVFVDNASQDGSMAFIVERFKDKRIAFVQNEKNYGVAGGRNIGFSKAKGEYVVFLDNDTEVHPQWLKGFLKAFEEDPVIAVAQAKLLRMDERKRFDHAGDYLTPLGFLRERSNQNLDTGQFDKVEDIFNAKGAATMVRARVFSQLGAYDDSYYMYQEETDFCYRAWLAGYRVVFAPDSIVWHAYNTSFKDTKKHYSFYVIRFYGAKNYITTLIKNLGTKHLFTIVPLHALAWIVLAFGFLLKGRPKDYVWVLKGVLWSFFELPQTMRKRSLVQKKLRKIGDNDFFKKIMIRQSVWFYFKKAQCYLCGDSYEEKFTKGGAACPK